MNSSNGRRLYEGQSIKQDTSAVFRTNEPETCILVVNSPYGTVLSLIEAADADKVAAEQWKTDEHLDDIYTRIHDGSILNLSSFIAGQDDAHSRHHETCYMTAVDISASADVRATVDIKASLDTSYEPRLLYDRKAAAHQLSISVRQLDRFIANRVINTRRIGSRVLIPRGELSRFSRADHVTDIS